MIASTASANSSGKCPQGDGTYDEAEIKGGGCDATPTLYEVTIYELYLCTSSPTIPTTSSAVVLTSCSKIFENASGAVASVSQNASISLSGTYTKPPNGTYTHGYAKMNNTFGLTWSGELDAAMTGLTGGTGVFCATVAGSGVYQQGTKHDDNSVCGSSAITPGKYVETLKHLDGVSAAFKPNTLITDINNNAGAEIRGLLVDTSGNLATNTADVDKLEGLVKFASSITVTDQTTSIEMSFNLGEGLFLEENDSDDKLWIGSGPFEAIMKASSN